MTETVDLTQDELWAWVTLTPHGRISLISVGFADIGQMPLIHHQRVTVLKMQRLAEDHGRALGQPVWLRRYTVSEEIGRITSTLRTANLKVGKGQDDDDTDIGRGA